MVRDWGGPSKCWCSRKWHSGAGLCFYRLSCRKWLDVLALHAVSYLVCIQPMVPARPWTALMSLCTQVTSDNLVAAHRSIGASLIINFLKNFSSCCWLPRLFLHTSRVLLVAWTGQTFSPHQAGKRPTSLPHHSVIFPGLQEWPFTGGKVIVLDSQMTGWRTSYCSSRPPENTSHPEKANVVFRGRGKIIPSFFPSAAEAAFWGGITQNIRRGHKSGESW